LYRNTGGSSPAGFEMALLWVLNMSDGANSLLDIADRAHMPFATIRAAADALRDTELLEVVDRSATNRSRIESMPARMDFSRSGAAVTGGHS
jgi:winged helix-turn-helix